MQFIAEERDYCRDTANQQAKIQKKKKSEEGNTKIHKYLDYKGTLNQESRNYVND